MITENIFKRNIELKVPRTFYSAWGEQLESVPIIRRRTCTYGEHKLKLYFWMHISSSIIRLLSSSFCLDRIQFGFACRLKMIKVFCFLLVTSLIFVKAKSLSNVAKVVGGDIAAINAFPYQAALISMKSSGFSICCGSVISAKAILTGELIC